MLVLGLGLSCASLCKADSAKDQVTPTFTETLPPQSANFHPTQTPDPGHVKLAFVGDINLGRHNIPLIDQKGDAWVFEACKPIFDQSDLVVANLESPVGEGGEEYTPKSVYLKGRPQDLDALSYAGFSLVTIANNHVLDYGPEVSEQTEEGLDKRGILHVGLVPSSLRPQQPVYVAVQGVTLAFLGYCSVCPGKFEAKKDRPGVEVALSSVMLPEIAKAKKKAKYVIVLLHWGREYYGANALQEKLAKSLHEGGADLVVGAHPHVLQKIKMLGNTLVAYSLGNFFFDMKYAACQNSCILLVDLRKGKKPQWKVVPVDLSSGRPEPLAEDSEQAGVIQTILKKGYEYYGKRSVPVEIETKKKPSN
jgi:poly-gamma-glutamate synthesis protein (capsule biosynthesis protein)